MLLAVLPTDVVLHIYYIWCTAPERLYLQVAITIPSPLNEAVCICHWFGTPMHWVTQMLVRAFRKPRAYVDLVNTLRTTYLPNAPSSQSLPVCRYHDDVKGINAWIWFEIARIMPDCINESVVTDEEKYPWLIEHATHCEFQHVDYDYLPPPAITHLDLNECYRVRVWPSVTHLCLREAIPLSSQRDRSSILWPCVEVLTIHLTQYDDSLNLRNFPSLRELHIVLQSQVLQVTAWESAVHLQRVSISGDRVAPPPCAMPNLTHLSVCDVEWVHYVMSKQTPSLREFKVFQKDMKLPS